MAFKAGAIVGTASLDTRKWTSGMSRMTTSAKVALAAIGTAVATAITRSVLMANEFQKAMSNVSTLVDTATIDMQALAYQVIMLSPELGKATELTKGLYQAFSAGALDAKDAMQITTDSAIFAKAALTDTLTAVDVLTTAVNAYGKEVLTTKQASDIFFTTIKEGKITGEELASTIGTSIPLFANVGISLEELSAGLAAMTKQGVSASRATTQMNAIVNSFLKPSLDMKDALADVGAESGAAFLKAEGLTGGLKLLTTAADGDAAALATLVPNVRGLRGVMALSGVGAQTFKDTLLEMEDAVGVTQEAFEKQEKTFETYLNSANKIKIVIGNIGKFFLDEIAVGATKANESMINFIFSAQFMEVVAGVVGTVAAVFKTLKLIFTEIVDAVKPAIKDVWEALTEAFSGLFGESELLAGASVVLSVVTQTIIAVIVILADWIVTLIGYYRDWIIAITETGKVAWTFIQMLGGKATWDDVKEGARTAGAAFADIGINLVEGVKGTFDTIKDQIDGFAASTQEIAADIESTITTTFDTASSHVRGRLMGMLGGQKDFKDACLDCMLNLPKATEEGTGEVDKIITDELFNEEAKFGDYFDTILSGFKGLYSGISEISTLAFENERRELDLQQQAEQEALQQRLDDKLITQEEYDTLREEMEEKQKAKRNELAEKVFDAEKKVRKAGIWIDTAGAIMGWWRAATSLGPVAGPTFGFGMSVASLIMAGKQIGLIDKQQFVPALARGGMVTGLARINERGGEIVTLPDGSQVIPNDISRQIAENVGTTINVSFNGAIISDTMNLEKVTNHVIKKLGREMRLAG